MKRLVPLMLVVEELLICRVPAAGENFEDRVLAVLPNNADVDPLRHATFTTEGIYHSTFLTQ